MPTPTVWPFSGEMLVVRRCLGLTVVNSDWWLEETPSALAAVARTVYVVFRVSRPSDVQVDPSAAMLPSTVRPLRPVRTTLVSLPLAAVTVTGASGRTSTR